MHSPTHASNPMPSRRLRTFARLARGLLWLLLTFWVLVGISWGLIHGWIVPRISEFRPRLESTASHALGVQVRIGQLSAESSGLNPSFEFHEVTLLDAAGRTALRLPHVVLGLSPLAVSGWGVAQLVVEGAELDVRRHADGRLEVAGLDLAQNANQSRSALADWALAQPELVLRGGQLRWTDEMRAAPPLVLSDVQAVLRNSGQRHRLRLDATPPPAWGERFSMRAVLREPFAVGPFGERKMPWENGTGELYAEFSRTDIAELQPYLDLGGLDANVSSGRGALRLWAELKGGEFNGLTADLALTDVRGRLASNLQPLALASVSGRISGQKLATGFEVRSEDLIFETEDRLRWPGGKLSLLNTNAEGQQASRTELSADALDLATLAALAAHLPLSSALHEELQSLAPRGRVEQLSARWEGPASQAQALSARGRVRGLSLAAGSSSDSGSGKKPATSSIPGRPGVEQLDLDFELSAQGGQAKLVMADGALTLPGVFAQPRLPLAQLSAQMKWTLAPRALTNTNTNTNAEGAAQDKPGADSDSNSNGGSGSGAAWGYMARIRELSLSDARFANADLAGRAELVWQAPAKGAAGPGLLDLQASLSRGRADAVHRYLPQVLPTYLRRYLEGALLGGEVSNARFKLKGDLAHFPFTDPRHGDLQLTARLNQVRLAYVPVGFLAATPSTDKNGPAKDWPVLEGLNGELLIQRNRLEARQLKGRATGLSGLQLQEGNVRIEDLSAPEVAISLQVKGLLAQGLQFVNQSPVSSLLGNALLNATATGVADYRMRLALPLADMGKTRMQASLVLPGNDLRLDPGTPLLSRARGTLSFTEDSLRVSNAQARVLGGDLRFEGGRPAAAAGGRPEGRTDGRTEAEPLLQFRGEGVLTAEGLRQASELGLVAQLAQHANGSAAYSMVLGVRRGEIEFKLNSPLVGMALNLPAPLDKAAADTLPLELERSLPPGPVLASRSRTGAGPLQDQLSLSLGERVALRYERTLEAAQAPRVLRGSVALGLPKGEALNLPTQGVAAKLQLGAADLDAWQALLGQPTAGAAAPAGSVQAYWPTTLALRAQSLRYQGYQLNQLALSATREGLLWRTKIDARELSGYAEFGQGSVATGNRLYARLTHLSLAANLAKDVENLLGSAPSQATRAVPALDIVVDDFELRGRKLGRLEVEAVNRPLPARDGNPREWQLNRLQLSSPEGMLLANGTWAVAATSTASERRRMALSFKLEVADAGGLLKRLDMDDLVARGKGRIEGQLQWTGSPLALDYPSLGGQFNVQIERGQFLKADPGIAKLLGVLSLQSLPRRLTLDFRDVFSEGFAFDMLRGDVRIEQGLATTHNLQMKGVNAAVIMEGSADIARETQQLQVLVIPEVNAGTVSLLASIANPAVGVGTFLAQLFLRGSINNAATQAFTIDGPWSEPRITRVERRQDAAQPTDKPPAAPVAKHLVPLTPAKP